MKTKILTLLLFVSIGLNAQRASPDVIKNSEGDITIHPVVHGTLVLEWNGKTIYVDPYGGAELFEGLAKPDIILITDIHGDHTNIETLKGLKTDDAIFVAPPAVAELIKDVSNKTEILKNDEMTVQHEIFIQAVPMYNLPETDDSKHPKGRGNGYFLNIGGKGIYISGDTEDIPEMRKLANIDVAFVCMNLPYTMDIKQAASAVLEFKPKIVYPYHYRGNPDMSDTKAFKSLVKSKNKEIDVRLKDWYGK